MLNTHNVTGLSRLNTGLALDISHMIQICGIHDNITYDIFMENGDNCNDIKCFYYYMENGIIVSFLSLFMPFEDCLNVYGCTLPSYRNKGIFSLLLSALNDELNLYNISPKLLAFPIKSDIPAFKNAVQYLKNRQYFIKETEYMLSYDLINNINNQYKTHLTSAVDNLELEYEETENKNEYSLWLEDNYIGGCLIYYSNISGNSKNISVTATIYDYRIEDKYQGLGYGKAGLKLILASLKQHHITSVILHTNSSNKKAFSLYTGCGFIIKDNIDYYSQK